jgi:AraC family transcriptional regulator, regulatory protein of adaptative response / methylated-DNA-[protein]-cysteine methyltransferase
MTELSTITSQPKSTNDITYGYGQSSLGGFLTATDDEGICAILLGDDQTDLLRNLQAAFPDGKLKACDRSGPCNAVADAVASLIEQPAAPLAYPTSIRGGDFEQMLYAALRQTKPGTTVTPAEVAVMIGGTGESAPCVRSYASKDFLAVTVPFHRLQELDGTSPAYRWGEKRCRALLKYEAAIRPA